MSNAARPKRAAEDYARTHHGETDLPSDHPSKKPRFDIRNPSALAPDALEEDFTLEADVIGKRGQQVRRNAVNVDGYDSDSENENFDTRASAKAKATATAAKAAKSKDEDESDMFADLDEDFKDGDDDEEDLTHQGTGKKAVRFLDEDEIEGQVSNSKSGGHVSADFSLNSQNGKGKGKSKARDDEVSSSSDSDISDSERAAPSASLDPELGAGSKKHHAPKLDAFNMKSENEEGRFDDQGNYVRKAQDPDAVHDNWLEGVSKRDMKRAAEAHEKREDERRKKDREDDEKVTGEVVGVLIRALESGETVLEALARVNRAKRKEKIKGKWGKGGSKTRKDKEFNGLENGGGDEEEAKRKAAVESITEAADLLLTRGQPDIYEAERELLIRQYRRETGEDWTEEEQLISKDAQWVYRWSDARDGGESHGPYDSNTMRQWNEAGYFGEGVEFQRLNDTDLSSTFIVACFSLVPAILGCYA